MTETAKCVRRKSGGLTAFVIFVRRGLNSAVIWPFHSLRMRTGLWDNTRPRGAGFTKNARIRGRTHLRVVADHSGNHS
jgi:hypothetical protein